MSCECFFESHKFYFLICLHFSTSFNIIYICVYFINQQQPASFFLFYGFSPPYGVLPGLGLLSSFFPTLALMSPAKVINALSTLLLALAEASMNLMPKLSASSLPSS